MRDGVDERVVLLVAPDLADEECGVEDEAGDDGGEDDDAQDQQARVADVEHDPADVQRHGQRHQADAEGDEERDGAPRGPATTLHGTNRDSSETGRRYL